MKFAVLADAHLTNSLPHTKPGDSQRKKMLSLYLYRFFAIIIDEAVDFLIIPGDLMHSTSLNPDDIDLLNYFIFNLLINSKIETIISLGNHDLDQEESVLKFFNRFLYDKINYCDRSISWSYFSGANKVNFDVINYCSHNVFLEKAREFPIKKKGVYNILVGHVGVKGSLHGSTKSIVGVKKENIEEIESNYDLVILGHHHNMQWVTKKCFYPGSIHQTRIDEIDTIPGGVIIEVKGGKVTSCTKVENRLSPRFLVVRGYKIDKEKIKGSIVKPILDLDSYSEKENLDFVKSIIECDPYYLISPRIKKHFEIGGAEYEYSAENKRDAISKTIKSFNLKKEDSREYEEHTINLWEKVRNEF